MVLSTLLFSMMGVCVKFASSHYGAGEIVFYRGFVGVAVMAIVTWRLNGTVKTNYPGMHVWRSVSGVVAQSMWFYSFAGLPLATAMTLNYMSSVWIGTFLLGGALMFGRGRVDWRLLAALLIGFGGVALVLRPTIAEQQAWHGLIGLISGVLSALAYLQVAALGRVGEPEYRVVFFFSIGGMVLGATVAIVFTGWHSHDSLWGVVQLIGAGLFATAAQLLLTRGYAIGSAMVNASLQYLGIVFSFVWGLLLFDDRMSLPAVLGMLLIIGAGLAATLLRTKEPALPTIENLEQAP